MELRSPCRENWPHKAKSANSQRHLSSGSIRNGYPPDSSCGLASVSTAHADAIDDKFLASLRNEGITDHVSSSHAIEAGHFVCTKLDNGVSVNDVVNDVLMSSNMPAYHSGFFVGASIDAYCPRHKAEIPT